MGEVVRWWLVGMCICMHGCLRGGYKRWEGLLDGGRLAYEWIDIVWIVSKGVQINDGRVCKMVAG